MAINARKVYTSVKRLQEEAASNYAAEAESQARARPRLLRPDEVAGEYDAGRLLTTTLGGVLRPLTKADLQTFSANAKTLGKAFRGGITAKGIIDMSLDADRERAKTEIHVALPTQSRAGKIHFTTNAGPESKVTRHHVLIEFMNFEAAVSSPNKASDVGALLAKGPIRCSCDCERWRYHYSYVATIGKFNSGIPQLGYPKLTNPHLVGAACKHVLRVMVVLASAIVRPHLVKMVEAGRRSEGSKTLTVSQREALALAKHQQATAHHKRNQIETSEDKRVRLAQQRAAKAVAVKANARIAKVKLTPAKMEAERRKFAAAARHMAAMGAISQKMLATLLAKLKQ